MPNKKTSVSNNENKKVKKTLDKKSEVKKRIVKKTKAEDVVVHTSIYKQLVPIILVMFLTLLVITLVTAYGFFTYSRSGLNPSKITTANLNIFVDDNEDLGINQENSFPVYDEVGREYDPYSFVLKNLGTVEANYKLKLVPDEPAIVADGCASNLLSDSSVKVQLIRDGVIVVESLLSELTDYVIDSGFIGIEDGVNNAYSYELRLWIDSAAGKEVMGRHYHGRIDVEISDPANS